MDKVNPLVRDHFFKWKSFSSLPPWSGVCGSKSYIGWVCSSQFSEFLLGIAEKRIEFPEKVQNFEGTTVSHGRFISCVEVTDGLSLSTSARFGGSFRRLSSGFSFIQSEFSPCDSDIYYGNLIAADRNFLI